MSRPERLTVSISIARAALESIFDDCDKFDVDETGGRLIGTYEQADGQLTIHVSDVLDAGPQAQRSPTFFMQDGNYQERRFREIEAVQPDIEHLGNWHTHHVNGYPTLSGGDRETYHRTVNHKMHNTDFFYALLVVSRNRGGGARYVCKHFLLRRGDDHVYEIPARHVNIVDAPTRPAAGRMLRQQRAHAPVETSPRAPNMERTRDQAFFAEFYPKLKSLMSNESGALYWKGKVVLVDGSEVDVVAMEDSEESATASYSILTSCKNPAVAEVVTKYRERQFRSARQAVVNLERDLNRALFQEKRREAI